MLVAFYNLVHRDPMSCSDLCVCVWEGWDYLVLYKARCACRGLWILLPSHGLEIDQTDVTEVCNQNLLPLPFHRCF